MKKALVYLLLTAWAIFSLFPFFWMLVTSLKPIGEGLSLKIIPKPITLENYRRILTQYNFFRYFLNSLIVAISSAFFSTLFAFLGAYALAKKNFLGKNILLALFLSAMMIPGMVYIVPQFAIVNMLGWMNTYLAMVVPHLANIFGLFLLSQFMRTLPNSLIESARIDGAGELRILWNIILPLSLPVIATVFLLNFQFHWNNFLWQLIVATRENMYTVPVGLAMFRSAHEELYTLKMAAATISLLPITMIFLFAQRFFIEGLTKGAVKG